MKTKILESIANYSFHINYQTHGKETKMIRALVQPRWRSLKFPLKTQSSLHHMPGYFSKENNALVIFIIVGKLVFDIMRKLGQ